jgi:hypothetical protein
VTLLDRIFGRGTNFICLDRDIDNKVGILIIQTFLSEDYSEKVQIKGSTVRLSKEGEYILVMLAENLMKAFEITMEEIEEMKKHMEGMYEYLNEKRMEMWETN